MIPCWVTDWQSPTQTEASFRFLCPHVHIQCVPLQVDQLLVPNGKTTLLSLPADMLSEIGSWSPSAASAAMLHSTCCAFRQVDLDPSAAALYLLRRHELDYTDSLFHSAGPRAGLSILRPVLLLLRRQAAGGPAPSTCDAGSHIPAASSKPDVEMLGKVMCIAAREGDIDTVKGLMATLHPLLLLHRITYGPDDTAWASAALLQSILAGPHLEVMQALLEGDADLCSMEMKAI